MRRSVDRSVAHVFAHDLPQRVRQDLPRENFDVLFDIPRFRLRESHDEFEERFGVRFALRNGERFESFEISTNSILLFDRETGPDERFEEVNRVDRTDETFVPIVSEDARDGDRIRLPVVLSDGTEGDVDDVSVLLRPELNQPSTVLPFFVRPAHRHRVEISLKFQDDLV